MLSSTLSNLSPRALPKNSTVVRSQTTMRLTRAALQAAYAVSEDLGTSFAERLFSSPRRHTRPERERQVLAAGHRFAIDVALRSPGRRGEHRRVAAWCWCHGPTALLVHGWEGRGAQLGGFVEPLVRAGLSVVAFDAPAHGDTAGHRLYLADLADCVVDVARAVGPLHAVVAHSLGAAAVVMAHQRGGVDARRNAMISPNAIISDAIARFARRVGLDDADRARFELQLAHSNGVTVEALGVEQLVGRRDAALLVIHDRDDREVPFTHGERLAAAWCNAALHATTGLGHRRILRDEAVIAEVVAFAADGVAAPASELVREVDRLLAQGGM